MDRTQRLLAGLLAAQLVILGLLYFVFPSSRAAAKEQPLVPSLASMTPQKVEIGDGTGASVALAREGGAWTLENPKGYPAESGKVEKLIEDIERLSATRPVASNRSSHAALKVADGEFERRLRIWEKPEGKPSLELFVGTSQRFQMSHVRVGGKDPVYEASGLSAMDLATDPGSWIARSLVPVAAESVTAFGLENRKGSFELEKRDGRWSVRTPASRSRATLDPQMVESLVSTLCSISLEAPAGPRNDAAQGLASPEATITFRGAPAPGASAAAAAAPVEVRIGAPVPGKDEQRYAGRSGFGYTVTVSKHSVDRALTATLSELLAK